MIKNYLEKYNKKELEMLHDLYFSAYCALLDECFADAEPDNCEKCDVKHFCEDMQKSFNHISKILFK